MTPPLSIWARPDWGAKLVSGLVGMVVRRREGRTLSPKVPFPSERWYRGAAAPLAEVPLGAADMVALAKGGERVCGW